MKEKAKDAKVAQIDACGNHSACLLSNGLLYTWGMIFIIIIYYILLSLHSF